MTRIVALLLLCVPCAAGEHTVTFGRPELVIKSPIYAAVIDCEYRCLSRITYAVTREDVQPATGDHERNWWTSRDVSEWALEDSDYNGSGFDRGHTRALRFSVHRPEWCDCNCMAAIVPQFPEVNRGPVKALEEHICELAQRHGLVTVAITCKFNGKARSVETADEANRVPSGFVYTLRPVDGTRGKRVEVYEIPNRPDVVSDYTVYRVSD